MNKFALISSVLILIIVFYSNSSNFVSTLKHTGQFKTVVGGDYWREGSGNEEFTIEQEACRKNFKKNVLHPGHGCCIDILNNVWNRARGKRNYLFGNYNTGKYDIINRFVNLFSNRSILFSGDSLTLQSCNAIVYMISTFYTVERIPTRYFTVFHDGTFEKIKHCENIWSGHKSTCGTNCSCNTIYGWYIPSTNTTISYHEFYTLLDKGIVSKYHSSDWFSDPHVTLPSKHPYRFKCGSLNLIQLLVSEYDHLVINIGLHEEMVSAYEYVSKLKHIIKIMDDTHKKHIFRLTLPQHYENGEYWSTQKIVYTTVPRHWSDVVARGVFVTTKPSWVKMLDVYNIFKDAWFLHGRDGTHYCFSFGLWLPFLHMLTECFD